MIIKPLPAQRSDSAKPPGTNAYAGVRIKTLGLHHHKGVHGVPGHVGFGGAPGEGGLCLTTHLPPADRAAPPGFLRCPPGRSSTWRSAAAAAPATLARSSAFPRSLALRTRPPVAQGPSRPPWRLSMIRRRVARGCHGGRRRVGRICSQNRGKALKQRKRWPSWTAGSRGHEPRPRGGGRVTGGGPPRESQAGPPRFYAERDVGGGAPEEARVA